MNFSDEKFYLKDVRTGKYHSMQGLTVLKDNATQFTEEQLKRRLKVAKTHTNKFREKMANSGSVMEPVSEKKEFELDIKSELSYSNDDILSCKAIYHFSREVLKKDIIYCPMRGNLKIPQDGKGELLKIELVVVRKGGKAVG